MKAMSRCAAPRLAAGVLMLAVSAGVGADTHIVPLRWGSAGEFEHRATVADGRFLEVCGALTVGSDVGWRFRTSEPAEFNVHYHVGKDVVYPVKLNASREAAQVLRAASKEDYCWMWTNRSGRPMEVWVRLERGSSPPAPR